MHRADQSALTGIPSNSDSFALDAAQAIWRAGVAAVDSAALVRAVAHQDGSTLKICGEPFDLHRIRRLIVVGAGKASAGMARGLEQALDPDLLHSKVEGWINVPADCVVPTKRIVLHAARPAGVNEPTEQGVAGSRKIIELVSSMEQDDLCIVLLSGGGSALLPLPVEGISLADKLAMTRYLSRHGATIHQLNSVRKRLSLIKGGGLQRAARAGRMVALIISDVIGDPLDIIASGPTVPDSGTASGALAILEEITAESTKGRDDIPPAVWRELQRQVAEGDDHPLATVSCRNHIIGNNETALRAASDHATSLGFDVRSLGSNRQGEASHIGRELAEQCLATRESKPKGPVCWIAGGEPVVHLVPTDRPRLGGRNQELALAALCRLWNEDLRGIVILSGGTDGEDGPTDAAGAICSEVVKRAALEQAIDPFAALAINDSYTFFAQVGGLLKTGPTHTNVMDLQVAIVQALT